MRLYALPWREPGGIHPDWRKGLQTGNLPIWTAEAFEALLQAVIVGQRRPLDVRCPKCPRLGYDEGRLLQIVGLFQHHRGVEAQAVLESWLAPAACPFAASPATGLARALKQAGLVIPLRRSIEAAIASHQLSSNPGLALVH